MIVQKKDNRLICITQREHARLSARLYENLTESLRPVRAAIRHHDDGWDEIDRSPLIRDQSILDYRSIPLEKHLSILEKSMERSMDEHPYAGWLVSKHGCSFHEEKSGGPVKRFLRKQSTLRKELQRSIRKDLSKTSSRDFDWLQFVDAVSLYVLDPWSERLQWNREVPGQLTIKPKSGSSYRVRGELRVERPLIFRYSYRSLRAGTDREPETLRKELRQSSYATTTVTIRSNVD